MVLSSTKQSLENREVSLVAILEVIVSVGIYWYIAYNFDFYWHIIISIGITPFLLLQSRKSIEFALSSFNNAFKKKSISEFLIRAAALILITYMIVYFVNFFDFIRNLFKPENQNFDYIIGTVTSNNFLFNISSFLVFFGFTLGLYMPFHTDEGRQKKVKNRKQKTRNKEIIEDILVISFILLFGISFGIGIVMIFTIYKIIATLINIREGYKNIISNWFYLIFVQDMKKIPEIMTGIESDEKIADWYKISKLFFELKTPGNIFRRITAAILLISLYPAALLYRISIKSTFWFYIPLLFVVKTPNLENSQEIGKFLSEQYQTIWAWIRGILAVGTLVAFIVTYFEYSAFWEASTIPFISIVSMLYLDFSSIGLWKLFQLSVAFLTIVLFLYSNAIRVPAVANQIPLKNDYRVMTIYYANTIRNWISLFYFTSAFIFLAYYFKVWEYPYMPHFMEDFLSNLIQYIQYKPFG